MSELAEPGRDLGLKRRVGPLALAEGTRPGPAWAGPGALIQSCLVSRSPKPIDPWQGLVLQLVGAAWDWILALGLHVGVS